MLTTTRVQANHHHGMGATAIHHQADDTRGGDTASVFNVRLCVTKTVAGNLSTNRAFMFEPQFDSENLIYGIHYLPIDPTHLLPVRMPTLLV